ncbi:hypothetical protein M3Y96_00424800 [Aphelenchoides besseyi]|nr:hypothetical protein M3Y96_00424800 [Aphelenchoides besseyi]
MFDPCSNECSNDAVGDKEINSSSEVKSEGDRWFMVIAGLRRIANELPVVPSDSVTNPINSIVTSEFAIDCSSLRKQTAEPKNSTENEQSTDLQSCQSFLWTTKSTTEYENLDSNAFSLKQNALDVASSSNDLPIKETEEFRFSAPFNSNEIFAFSGSISAYVNLLETIAHDYKQG